MTDRDTAVADDEAVRAVKLADNSGTSGSPVKQGFITDECRVQDALEDDEVREILKASHRDDAKPG